jgi:hypothetical protein
LFLDTFNFSVDDLPRDIVCLFGIYVGLLIAAYLLLWVFYSSSDVKVKANAKRSMKWYEKIGKKFSRPTKKGNKMDVSTQSLQK